MANAAVASWTACIKELQQLLDAPSTAYDAADRAMDKIKLSSDAPMPHAAFKKLVHDVQVQSCNSSTAGADTYSKAVSSGCGYNRLCLAK